MPPRSIDQARRPAVLVSGLTKYYGRRAAIRNLTFTIERGTIVGFLGLNGAGKSTTLRILAGVLLPTAGRIEVTATATSRSTPRRRAAGRARWQRR